MSSNCCLASFLRYKPKLHITSTSHSMRWLIHYTNVVCCLLFFFCSFINDLFQHQSLKNSRESHEFWMPLWRWISVQNSKWKMPSYNGIQRKKTTNFAIEIKNSFQSPNCFGSVASSNCNDALSCILCTFKSQSIATILSSM